MNNTRLINKLIIIGLLICLSAHFIFAAEFGANSMDVLSDDSLVYADPLKGIYCYTPGKGLSLMAQDTAESLKCIDDTVYYMKAGALFCYDSAAGKTEPIQADTDLYSVYMNMMAQSSADLPAGSSDRVLAKNEFHEIRKTGDLIYLKELANGTEYEIKEDAVLQAALGERYMYLYSADHGGYITCYEIKKAQNGSIDSIKRLGTVSGSGQTFIPAAVVIVIAAVFLFLSYQKHKKCRSE